MTNRTDGLDAVGVAEAIEKYASACKRNAFEMKTMPMTAIRQHFSEFADEILALSRSALVDAPAGERTKSIEALVDARDCMSRAADIFDGHLLREEAGRLRRVADVCRAALEEHRKAALASPTPSVAALQAEIERLTAEMANAREYCPLVRRQDYFDTPLPELVLDQVSEMFRWQSRAETAEAELDRLKKAVISACGTPQIVE